MSSRGLALRRIVGHCSSAGDRITAWYRLAPQGWSFRPDSARERLIVDTADALAQLTKRSLHLRITTRPYPVSRWAESHDTNAPAPLPGWPEHLIRDQMHLASRSMADKEVYLGVDLGATKRFLHSMSGMVGPAGDREVAAMAKPIRALDELMRHPGLAGDPATPRQLEWLLHRSCSLGLPAPLTLGAAEHPEWEREDLHEFTDHVTWTATPYGRTIQVRGEHDGAQVERHVCVLSVGRMTDLDIPLGVPWIQRTDQLSFPVEWSARVTIEGAARCGRSCSRADLEVQANCPQAVSNSPAFTRPTSSSTTGSFASPGWRVTLWTTLTRLAPPVATRTTPTFQGRLARMSSTRPLSSKYAIKVGTSSGAKELAIISPRCTALTKYSCFPRTMRTSSSCGVNGSAASPLKSKSSRIVDRPVAAKDCHRSDAMVEVWRGEGRTGTVSVAPLACLDRTNPRRLPACGAEIEPRPRGSVHSRVFPQVFPEPR
ncbi:hypothetical protein GCM10012283_20290 [Phycicoccus endophyticus]|nr:hypothetical protein GCM10012283_20290 [Phycicoccus endophyticus]